VLLVDGAELVGGVTGGRDKCFLLSVEGGMAVKLGFLLACVMGLVHGVERKRERVCYIMMEEAGHSKLTVLYAQGFYRRVSLL
jgi:hypothetical protein